MSISVMFSTAQQCRLLTPAKLRKQRHNHSSSCWKGIKEQHNTSLSTTRKRFRTLKLPEIKVNAWCRKVLMDSYSIPLKNCIQASRSMLRLKKNKAQKKFMNVQGQLQAQLTNLQIMLQTIGFVLYSHFQRAHFPAKTKKMSPLRVLCTSWMVKKVTHRVR